MRHRIHGLTSATLLAAASTVLSFSVAAQKVPDGWICAKEQPLLQVHAKGDQVYTCKSDAAQLTWTLKAPDAQLFDKDGKPFGKHSAGPSWEASDGSRVTGKAVANTLSPDADSIPWLLVNVISHDGSGRALYCHNYPAPQHQRWQSTSVRMRRFARRSGSPRAIFR